MIEKDGGSWDTRINEVLDVIMSIASLDYSKKASVFEDGDLLDALAAGVNMLGESINSLTIKREYVQNIIYNISDLLVVINEHGIISNVNKEFCQATGYSETEIMGKRIHKLMEKEGSFKLERLIHLITIGEAKNISFRCVKKVIVGCMTETSCALTASAQIVSMADWVDLDANMLTANDPFSGMKIENGKIVAGSKPGLGLKLNETGKQLFKDKF